MFTRKWLSLAMVFALVACGDTSATEPTPDNPVLLTVSGTGQAAVTMALGGDPSLEPPNTSLDPFSITATSYVDGTAEGKVTVRNVKFGPVEDRAGDVTCMARIGASGMVLIGADIAVPSTAPTPPDGYAYYFSVFVRDNGDGAGAAPDQIFYGYQVLPVIGLDHMCLTSSTLIDASAVAQIESVLANVEGGNIKVE